MSQQCVLLVGRPGLLVQGIHEILKRQGEIEVLGPYPMTANVVAFVESACPDAIVIAGEGPTDIALVAHILRTCPGLPIVRVGLQDNLVRVYTSQRLAATSTSLLDAIRGLSPPGAGAEVSLRSTEE